MVSRAWPKLGIPSPLTHYGLTEKNEAPLPQQTWAWAPFQCPPGCLSHHLHRVRRVDRYVSFTETQEMVTWPLRFHDSSCLLSCSKGVTETEAALSWCLTLPSGVLPVTQDYQLSVQVALPLPIGSQCVCRFFGRLPAPHARRSGLSQLYNHPWAAGTRSGRGQLVSDSSLYPSS